ncbi:arsenate reductase (azurin) small subunit [Bordetella tumulicola]|uniref:arsenate reductase (azurin) small subunit n=1 Tax=Bordetella tumulicola TaxID=1649133 RepID=UPI0039EFFBC8
MSETPILTRRGFLKVSGSGGVAAAAALIPIASVHAQPAEPTATGVSLPYPEKSIGAAKQLTVEAPLQFTYPDEGSPCVAVKLGRPTPGGVGPERDVVAYSTLCTHMGCPTVFDGKTKTFKCPCHFSEFDAERAGQMICGQATENLPRILLRYDTGTDAIAAVGVEGLIYGRQANVL